MSQDSKRSDPELASGLTRISGQYTQQSDDERARNRELYELAAALMPQYGHQWNLHGLATVKRQTISRVLYYDHLYRKVVGVPGVICEFGVQWGATLAQLINFRGIYEPYNLSRKIIGFDTFEGFSTVDPKDGGYSKIGDYASVSGHENTLEQLLDLQESFSPLSHLRRFQLVKGDASQTIAPWLDENPHAIIAMAIFDMDVYKPTREVLEKIRPRLTKGSLLVFDELNCQAFPGETLAVTEVLGLNNLALRHFPHQPYCAWAVYGE